MRESHESAKYPRFHFILLPQKRKAQELAHVGVESLLKGLLLLIHLCHITGSLWRSLCLPCKESVSLLL